MTKPIYNIGDKVITKGYTDEYDGKILTIKKIIYDDPEYFYHFEESTSPGHNFGEGHVVRVVQSNSETEERKYTINDIKKAFIEGTHWKEKWAKDNSFGDSFLPSITPDVDKFIKTIH